MTCSFCGKGESEVQRLVAGPAPVAICDECVALAAEVLLATAPPPAEDGGGGGR